MLTPYFRLRILGEESSFPNVAEIGTFIWDFATLYEMAHFVLENPDREITRFRTYRNAYRVPEMETFRLEHLQVASPIDLAILLNAARPIASKALNAFLKLLEFGTAASKFGEQRSKVQDIEQSSALKRMRERNEIAIQYEVLEQKRLENLSTKLQIAKALGVDDLPGFLSENDRYGVVRGLQERLARSPVQVRSIKVEYKEIDRQIVPSDDEDPRS